MIVPLFLLALALLLASDRQHIVREIELDVLGLEPGQLRHDLDRLVGFAHIHARHRSAPGDEGREIAPEAIEQPVDLLLEECERIGVLPRDRTRAAYGNYIFA